MANYVRFAADEPVEVELAVNGTVFGGALRTLGKDLPLARSGSTFYFTLPGPGTYYLQLPDLNTPRRITYTVFFFYDALSTYTAYQQAFTAAKNATQHGVVSHPTQNQTGAVQNLLNAGGAIYFPPGIYRTGQLAIPSNTTVYLAPGALLKGTDNYNTARYIWIGGASNVRIAGLGAIDANGHTSANMQTKGHGIDMESCNNVVLDDVLFRDTNSWCLHIRRCDNVTFTNIKVFSGKDGIDPDGARDVLIQHATIQSIDDAFAVKSKFSGRSCERVTMRDCIVFSCASSLKIGTENYYGSVRDITWDNCDVVDADRACIMYTNSNDGTAPVSNITWRNIRIFNFSWAAETGGAPFQFHNDGGASVSNLRIENVVAYPVINCSARGGAGATFRNVIVHGASNIPTSNMTFEGVLWSTVTSQSRPVVFIAPSARNQNEYHNGDTVAVTVQHPFGVATASVELFIDGVSAGVDTSAPYGFVLNGVALGTRVLTARATDANNASNTTAPLRIRVVGAAGPPTNTPTVTATPTVTPTLCPCDGTGGPVFYEDNGRVVIEAEHYASQEQRNDPEPWALSTHVAGALCQGYMTAQNADAGDTTFAAGARLNYRFHVFTAGLYAVKLRRYVTSGTDDSCYLGINGAQLGDIYDNSSLCMNQGWCWVAAGTFSTWLEPGEHTLNLVRRQKNYRVDRIMISRVGLPADGDGAFGPCASATARTGNTVEAW